MRPNELNKIVVIVFISANTKMLALLFLTNRLVVCETKTTNNYKI